MIRHFRKHGWQHDTAHRLTRRAVQPAAMPEPAPVVELQLPKEGFGRRCYRVRSRPGQKPKACRLGKAVQMMRKHRRAVAKLTRPY